MAGRELAVNVTVVDDEGRGTTYMAGTKVSTEVAKLITNKKVWATDEADDEAADDKKSTPSLYAKFKVEDLHAEIEKRNAGREDDAKLSTAGNKPDLIAALEADDEAAVNE